MALDEADQVKRLNPIARAFLQGVYDERNELSKLHGMWHILRKIWRYVTDYWKSNIKISSFSVDEEGRRFDPDPAFLNLHRKTYYPDDKILFGGYDWWPYIFEDDLVFPKPTGIEINMMPFVMVKDFSKALLPSNLEGYFQNIIQHCLLEDDQIGKIGYLTIQESFVQKDTSQRRPGIHTEKPGVVRFQMKTEVDDTQRAASSTNGQMKDSVKIGDGDTFLKRFPIRWGRGELKRPRVKGGIFMASNVGSSCKMYNCRIMNDQIIGEHGDIEHLKECLPEGEILQENCLYWFTDRTPHESLPLNEDTNRQFIRVVTSDVSVWFEDHSTKNPLGVVPDPKKTRIVKGSKFDKSGVVFSDGQV